MVDDPFPQYGLNPVRMTDQTLLNAYFQSLAEPLSDYTFSQLYSWRNSLRILWREIEGHLCVFANGTGDLTLLMPPIGDTGGDRALAACWEVMDDYNRRHQVPDRSRIEYASEELLTRFDRAKLNVQPMGTDYLYDVNRMIDLAGGDLASKRQAKNRFLRNYTSRVETYDTAQHFEACCALLERWKSHQDASHASDIAASSGALKRQKESIATRLALENATELGLKGMVVYVKESSGFGVQGSGQQQFTPGAERSDAPDSSASLTPDGFALRGFTFGEPLGRDQSSIVIEKTDLEVKGLTQFIFSEFCRTHFPDRPLVNVGDDWGLETLAWTKMSYRPVKLLQKYVLAKAAAASSKVGYWVPEIQEAPQRHPEGVLATAVFKQPDSSVASLPQIDALHFQHPTPDTRYPIPEISIRYARKDDLAAAVELENTCFTTYGLTKRQLQYLQQRQSSIFLVAEQAGRVIGEAIALVRHHKKGLSGRVYSLAVSNEARGQKIGRKLMGRIIEELTARGIRRVFLEVEKSNDPAIKLYEALGFRSLGILPDYYGQGRAGWHMVYEVQAQPSLFEAAVA